MSFELSPCTLWLAAIQRWRAGDPQGVVDLLHGTEPLPDFARAFLARVAVGTEKRKRGRKVAEPTAAAVLGEDLIREKYEFALALARALKRIEKDGGGSPSERAKAALAGALGKTEGSIDHIVHRRAPRKRRG